MTNTVTAPSLPAAMSDFNDDDFDVLGTALLWILPEGRGGWIWGLITIVCSVLLLALIVVSTQREVRCKDMLCGGGEKAHVVKSECACDHPERAP